MLGSSVSTLGSLSELVVGSFQSAKIVSSCGVSVHIGDVSTLECDKALEDGSLNTEKSM